MIRVSWFRCRERYGRGERLLVAPDQDKATVYAVELGLRAPVECEEYTEVLTARMMAAMVETAGIAAEILGDEQMKHEATALRREAYSILKEARQKLGKQVARG